MGTANGQDLPGRPRLQFSGRQGPPGNRRNDASTYHLSPGLDYPQPSDIAAAKAGGHDPGGGIVLHGQPNALPGGVTLRRSWTTGCIALSDAETEELCRAAALDIPVEIRP